MRLFSHCARFQRQFCGKVTYYYILNRNKFQLVANVFVICLDNTCTKVREGALPSQNLPQKSCSSTMKPTEPRSTSTITKRELFQQQQQLEFENAHLKPCYHSYDDFLQRVNKLKLSTGWSVCDHMSYMEAKYGEPGTPYIIPKYQIFVNKDLTYVLRCYGWTISSNSDIKQKFPSFNVVTFSDFLKSLNGYKMCSGN